MNITLEPIPVDDLIVLAASDVPARLTGRFLDGAIPPAFVAERALEHLRNGKPAHWCCTFYIRDNDQMIAGGCGYKDAPHNGRIEIGYAVSPARRGQGIASSAASMLVRRAFASGEVSEVLAQILEQNLASTRVAEKLGFVPEGVVDDDDGRLVQWIRRPSIES